MDGHVSVKMLAMRVVTASLLVLMLISQVFPDLLLAQTREHQMLPVRIDPLPAPFLRVDNERLVRFHDIVYRRPVVRPSEYLPLGNGDVRFMVDPFGSMTLGGWVAKADLYLDMVTQPPFEGVASLHDWQVAWAKDGHQGEERLSKHAYAHSDYFQGRTRARVAGQVRSELSVDGQALSDPNQVVTNDEQRLDIYYAWVTTRFRWPGKMHSEASAFVHSGKNLMVFRYQDAAEKSKKVSRKIYLARAVWDLYKFTKDYCCPPDGKGVAGRETFTVRADEPRQSILLEYSNKSGMKMTMAMRAVGSKARLVVEPKQDPNATFDYNNLPRPSDDLNPLPMRAGNACFETETAPRLDVTVLASVVTNGDDPDPTAKALQILDEAAKAGFGSLQREHAAWWHDFWKRSFVEFADKDLENFWYQVNYQMAASSRGKIAPSICQLWVTTPEFPWQGGYWSFNHAAMYTGINVTNHAELGDPFWRLMQRCLPAFRETARKQFDTGGIAIDTSFGPEGYPHEGMVDDFEYYGAAFIAVLEYWRYLYNPDLEVLRREIYPFMKEAVEHYQGLLVWDDLKRQYNMPLPSCSINECDGFTGLNDPFDLATIRRLLLMTIQASEILGADADLRAKWEDFESKIAPFPNDGKRYLLYEGLRGAGHLLVADGLGLAFPTGMVDTETDPLWPATLGDVMPYGMGGQCFAGMMWAAAAAWTGRGDTMPIALHAEFRRHLFPNGLLGEGQLTFVPEYGRAVPGVVIAESAPWGQSAISEGFVRSLYDGIIRVFSAPPGYYDGRETPSRFAGLRAINGFVVSGEQIGDAGWVHAPVRFVTIQSLVGKECKFELPRWKPEELVVEAVDRDTGKMLRLVKTTIKQNVASFSTEAGATYLLYPRGKRPERVWGPFLESDRLPTVLLRGASVKSCPSVRKCRLLGH